ncbi:MAG TPA: cytochrome b562 [Acidobacteriota bacterium]|nr:cytochrome b562 [Acidobacteriota bacterium]
MSRILLALSLLISASLPAAAAPQDEEKPEIVQRMENMNDILRQIRRQSRDAANKASVLELIKEFRLHALAAQKEKPLKTADLPEEEREAFVAEFRQTIDKMLSTLDEFQAAVEAGDSEQAGQLLRRLFEWKKEGHSQFRVQDEDPS